MKRLSRIARATFVPLLALVGVALLAWGVIDWRRFYRDLYLEEASALRALAEEAGIVRYRRAGDLKDRKLVASAFDGMDFEFEGADHEPPVPASVPFVGRVEFVDADDDRMIGGGWRPRPMGPVTKAVRDRVTSLPGLRGYRDPGPADEPPPPTSVDDLRLDRPLPDLPPALLERSDLESAFPTGISLEGEELRAAARAVFDAWDDPPDLPDRTVRVHRSWTYSPDGQSTDAEALHIRSGERRLDFFGNLDELRYESSRRKETFPSLTLRDELTTWRLRISPEERTLLSFVANDLPEAELPDVRFVPRAIGNPFDGKGLEWTPQTYVVGESSGERIDAIERLGDGRLAISSTSNQFSDNGPTWTFRAIVRGDPGYALERCELRLARGSYAFPSETIYREARRLEERDGIPIVIERLASRESRGVGDRPAAGSIEERMWESHNSERRLLLRERIATRFEPSYPDSLFDPESYGVERPEPRALATARPYRFAWAAGLGCLILAGIASLARRPRRRRSVMPVTERATGRRSFVPRFGLISLMAATLLTISVSGWIKRRVDDARDQQAALTAFAAEASWFDYEREEPGFPWTYFSADAFPIGAPLRRVTSRDVVSPEALDGILRLSPSVRYDSHFDGRSAEIATEPVASDAFDAELPRFIDDPWIGDRFFAPIERGVPLTPDESNAMRETIQDAWRRARAEYPTRYLARVGAKAGPWRNLVEYRDGERYWRIDEFDDGTQVDAYDGRFRRRFRNRRFGEWPLAERRSFDDEPIRYARHDSGPFPWNVPFLSVHTGDDGAFPRPPFATPPLVKGAGASLGEEMLEEAAWSSATLERLPDGKIVVVIEREADRRTIPAGEVGGQQWYERDERTVHWTAVLRPDLDWCVESCRIAESYLVPPSSTDSSPDSEDSTADPFGSPLAPVAAATGDDSPTSRRRRTEVRYRNVLRRIDGRVVPLATLIAANDQPSNESFRGVVEDVRYAIEFDPPIDDRIFSRPTIDAPDPPVPPAESPAPWYVVTFLVAAATLAFGSVRSLFVGIRRRFATSPTGGTSRRESPDEGDQQS